MEQVQTFWKTFNLRSAANTNSFEGLTFFGEFGKLKLRMRKYRLKSRGGREIKIIEHREIDILASTWGMPDGVSCREKFDTIAIVLCVVIESQSMDMR